MIGSHAGLSSNAGSPWRAFRMPLAFSWISQPIDLRFGSSPAVVSTIQHGCFLAAPAPKVMMSHSSRLGWACSSSKITQLGL